MLTLLSKNLRNFGEDFRQVSKTCSLRLMRNVLWNEFSGKINFFIISAVCAKKCPTFGTKASAEMLKLHSTCPHESYEDFFLKKKHRFFKVFWLWAKTFLILVKTFGWFLKPAIYLSWGMFCGIAFLQRLNFFVIFGVCAKTCRAFGKKNSGELS